MTSVFVKQMSRDICAVRAVINHTRPSAQKKSTQNLVLVDVNHLRLLADCMYYNMKNLPQKNEVKPCSVTRRSNHFAFGV